MSCGVTFSTCFCVFLAKVVFPILGAVFLSMRLSSTCLFSNIFLSSLILVTVGGATFLCSLLFITGGTECDGCCSCWWLYIPVVAGVTLGGCWGWGLVVVGVIALLGIFNPALSATL